MKYVVSSDMWAGLVRVILDLLNERGHEVRYLGPTEGEEDQDWPLVSAAAARAVAMGEAEEGVVICWTGTGASIAANKVTGVRAALCGDAETARGARRWNHANVLALSIRATSEAMAREILEAWLEQPWGTDPWNREQVARIEALDQARAEEGDGVD